MPKKTPSISTGLQRNTIDKFYTKPDVVCKCVKTICDLIQIDDQDTLIEPSAGSGNFSKKIKETFPKNKVIAYDIQPDSEDIEKTDFLQLEIEKEEHNNIHIIGNPPFGRQSSLAKKFVKKGCQFATSISFILPKSFKKTSYSKVFDDHFHNIYSCDLEENAFLINNEEYNVPSVFQIWIKKDTMRVNEVKQDPIHYTFVKKTDNPDLSIRRVGVYTCKCDKETDNKSIQSHYFLKLNDEIDIDHFLEKFKTLSFEEKDNTVGSKSISKQELIKYTNKLTFE